LYLSMSANISIGICTKFWLLTCPIPIHYLGISTVALLLGKPGNLPATMVYIISLIAGFVVAYALNAVISRIPFFRWAVLGLKKEGNIFSE